MSVICWQKCIRLHRPTHPYASAHEACFIRLRSLLQNIRYPN